MVVERNLARVLLLRQSTPGLELALHTLGQDTPEVNTEVASADSERHTAASSMNAGRGGQAPPPFPPEPHLPGRRNRDHGRLVSGIG